LDHEKWVTCVSLLMNVIYNSYLCNYIDFQAIKNYHHHKLMTLHPRVLSFIADADFYKITCLQHVKIDHGLLSVLVKR